MLAHELTHVVQQDYQETRPKRIRSDHIGQLIQRVPAPGRNFGTRTIVVLALLRIFLVLFKVMSQRTMMWIIRLGATGYGGMPGILYGS